MCTCTKGRLKGSEVVFGLYLMALFDRIVTSIPQTHRSASPIVSFGLGGSVQNARGAKKRVLGGNPDVHLYVVGAMPAGNPYERLLLLANERNIMLLWGCHNWILRRTLDH